VNGILLRQNPVRAGHDVLAHVEPEGHHEVDNEGRTKRDKGRINEIHPYARRLDMHPLAQLLAYAEGGFLKEMPVVIKKSVDLPEWLHTTVFLSLCCKNSPI
jgi:hypothetical protein